MKKNEKLDNIRHSAAHLAAQAVLELFPGTKLTIGPTTETGFFYDFLPTRNFTEEDLPVIEAKMHELSKKNYKIEGKLVSKKEALILFKDNEFKEELINNITDEKVGVYCQGNFCDLCKGGHVESTGEIKYFKLTSVAGSYWRADKNNTALQRIYGIAFETEKDLNDYLTQIEEAQKYDHRKLGKQLELFSFHPEAPGSAFFLDKGLKVYNKLIDFMRFMLKRDYQEIKTPMILNESLWHTSGHYENYKNNMYFTTVEDTTYCVKPMNCPAGILVYKEKPKSYREFPLRVAEYGHVYRYELSGVLHGLFRVRSFTQDDAHVFCTPDQVVSEVEKMLKLAIDVYSKFDFKEILMAVSTRPEKYIGDIASWDAATQALKTGLENKGLKYKIKEGEGAFYGPKIEVVLKDMMGREWQCGTIQVDFFMPKNFNIEYIKADQTKDTPVMLHRAIYGSIERFLGILVEHYKGRFPFWLAPVQARVLTITDDVKDYAGLIFDKLFDADIRVEQDKSGDQLSAQVRNAQVEQIPWMIVIGKKEQENKTVTLRHLDGKQEFNLTVDELIKRAQELNKF
ncbi:MAG: Threonine-tRNA ligase [candidate division TM6 bacterium GW2011_GWF2_28_16]|nr:MAG: Threonine-tRNA ligase [candidate division TM6 bacterium GW2011_GWF2_28_16]